MIRFFVEPEDLEEDFPRLTGENANHGRVLRLRTGEQLLLCDGQGLEAKRSSCSCVTVRAWRHCAAFPVWKEKTSVWRWSSVGNR